MGNDVGVRFLTNETMSSVDMHVDRWRAAFGVAPYECPYTFLNFFCKKNMGNMSLVQFTLRFY